MPSPDLLQPLDVLTLGVPQLRATLESSHFGRAGLRVESTSTVDELLDCVDRQQPHLVIVDADVVAPRHEHTLRHELRERTNTRAPVVLLAVPADGATDRSDLCDYDGIVSLDTAEADVAAILAARFAAPVRATPRLAVRIPVMLASDTGPATHGFTVDISASGAGLFLPGGLVGEDRTHALFNRNDGRAICLEVRTVWSGSAGPPVERSLRLGVRFVDPPRDAIRVLYDLALWELTWEQGLPVLVLHGEITEGSFLAPVRRRALEVAALDLGDVRNVTGGGVAEWVRLVSALPPDHVLRLRRVPGPFSRRILTAPVMLRNCLVESMLLPYSCEDCDAEAEPCERLAQPGHPAPEPLCPVCAAPLTPDAALVELLRVLPATDQPAASR